ncbi:Beta-glucosidase 11 [Zea mays]|uniref:Beta-glucosidase 11 n=1 Tax=Zea mays TaxID=4577 RepID=A0A1D6N901_MAIZE|nr:Beta-glucosidase 11 [Zea mays]
MAATFAFIPLLLLVCVQSAAPVLGFTRSEFPEDFVFGSATSAYQYEGAVGEDGRSPSIWDTFTHAGRMPDKSNGDVAADGYNKYKDDVKLIIDNNLEAYRFSISWSRLIPSVQVHVMIYQLDLPQILEDEYGGWLSPMVVEDFTAYADVCFREFGDRVSHWTTLDEVNVAAIGSYDNGQIAPGRCSDPFGTKKCTAVQKGVVGINIYTMWSYPLTNSTADLEATQRFLDFYSGWILEPLVFGDYPSVMKKNVGSRLPSFSKVQSEAIRGTLDFIGINHYYSFYVNDRPLEKGIRDFSLDIAADYRVNSYVLKFFITSIFMDRDTIRLILSSLSFLSSGYATTNGSLHDTDRVDYMKTHISSTLAALRNGANVKGYFAWCFLDVFEYLSGFMSQYGLYRVDFEDEALPRQARLSARWYSKFLENKGIHVEDELDDAGSHVEQ